MPNAVPFIAYHGTKARFARFDENHIDHFGFHLGTEEQARHFGKRVLRVEVRISHALRLDDLGTWNYQAVIREARKAGVAISEAEYDEVFNQFDEAKATRRLLERKGYDGIIYRNMVEGASDSSIAFRADQLTITGTV